MELSEKIQKLRKERGLTQEQFAEQLFVSRTAVSKWETGRGTPSMESLQLIAKFFGITLDELFITPKMLSGVVDYVHEGKISLDHGKKILYQAIEQKIDPVELIKKENLQQISDEDTLLELITSIMSSVKIFPKVIAPSQSIQQGTILPSTSTPIWSRRP